MADREAKGRLLDEAVAVTGRHRKSLIRAWRVELPAGKRPRRACRPDPVRARGRTRATGDLDSGGLSLVAATESVVGGVGAVGASSVESGAGDRTRPAPDQRSTDRSVTAPHRQTIQRRQYGRTKPGRLLKHHIPLKTDRWNVHEPGFTEIDLVAHSGDRADGDFAQSLNLTDIHTTWVETGAVVGKSQVRVRAMLERLRAQLPFRLQGIDSDNGSEFINAHLYRFCQAEQIQFTRGRPYKKDDNAHIEQKNWTHVRKVMGYERYDTDAAVRAMNVVYTDLRLLQNLFLPSVKLVRKERVGAHVRRRYDAPQTPLDRLRVCPAADPVKLHALLELARTLDPFDLARRVDEGLERVYRHANFRRTSGPRRRVRWPQIGQQTRRQDQDPNLPR